MNAEQPPRIFDYFVVCGLDPVRGLVPNVVSGPFPHIYVFFLANQPFSTYFSLKGKGEKLNEPMIDFHGQA